ncbi:MAG: hypothetical protein ACI3WR_07925 [Oscillospiraceae bacterium]
MKSCEMVCGLVLGMAVGAGVVLMLPARRTACVKKQMKHTLHDVEGVLEDAMDGIHTILNT